MDPCGAATPTASRSFSHSPISPLFNLLRVFSPYVLHLTPMNAVAKLPVLPLLSLLARTSLSSSFTSVEMSLGMTKKLRWRRCAAAGAGGKEGESVQARRMGSSTEQRERVGSFPLLFLVNCAVSWVASPLTSPLKSVPKVTPRTLSGPGENPDFLKSDLKNALSVLYLYKSPQVVSNTRNKIK